MKYRESRLLNIVKDLVFGRFSLAVTFWVWGVCGGLFLGMLGIAGIYYDYIFIYAVTSILKFLLFAMVLSGIICILKRKISFLGAIAFLIVLMQVIAGIIVVVIFSAALLEWFAQIVA